MLTAIRSPRLNTDLGLDIVQNPANVEQADTPNDTPEHPENPQQERGASIYKGLVDGEAECPICSDGIDAETTIWSCKSCYHIYHFTCIQRWAENKRTTLWPCPTCKTPQISTTQNMSPSCWCGKQRHADIAYRGNTCGGTCFRLQKCDANPPCLHNCSKLCHPGPCEPVSCKPTCPSGRGTPPKPPNMSLLEYYREINRAEKRQEAPPRPSLQRRDRSRDPGDAEGGRARDGYHNVGDDLALGDTLRGLITAFFAVAVLQAPFIWWFMIRIEKWTRPLQHTHFTETRRGVESKISFAMALFWSMFTGLITCMFVVQWLNWIFCRRSRHCCSSLMAFIIAVSVSFVLFTDLFALRLEAPGWAWNSQMKDSCRGFDTRVKLDIEVKDASKPSENLLLYTPDLLEAPIRQPGVDEFHFTTTYDLTKPSDEPFFTYHRMTGNLPSDPHLAIDFDLPKHQWRIMNLTYTDANLNLTTLGPGTTETLFKSRTWTQTNSSNPHVLIPELKLQIPNMHYFTRHCAYQPFMKVYSTADVTIDQISEQGERKWSSENEQEVVMRTAAFGLKPNRLDVCARRNDYEVDGQMRDGLREDIVVPLGLFAALRLQMLSDGKKQKTATILTLHEGSFMRGCDCVDYIRY